jgi:hypothetical protein
MPLPGLLPIIFVKHLYTLADRPFVGDDEWQPADLPR